MLMKRSIEHIKEQNLRKKEHHDEMMNMSITERIEHMTQESKLNKYQFAIIEKKQKEIDNLHEDKNRVIKILDRKVSYVTQPSETVDRAHIV